MEGWEGVGSWKMGWGMGGWGEAHKRKWGGTRDGPMKLKRRKAEALPSHGHGTQGHLPSGAGKSTRAGAPGTGRGSGPRAAVSPTLGQCTASEVRPSSAQSLLSSYSDSHSIHTHS